MFCCCFFKKYWYYSISDPQQWYNVYSFVENQQICVWEVTQKLLKQISAAFDFKGYNICIEISGFWYGYLPL